MTHQIDPGSTWSRLGWVMFVREVIVLPVHQHKGINGACREVFRKVGSISRKRMESLAKIGPL